MATTGDTTVAKGGEKEAKNARISLYVHIPFCVKKCLYCGFNSRPSRRDEYGAYIDLLLKEFSHRIKKCHDLGERSLASIYLGGGTPSLLSSGEVNRLLDGVRRLTPLRDDREVTIEVNPGTVDLQKLKGYREAGCNRLSLGIQSLNDRYLTLLGRSHSGGDGVSAFRAARTAGFGNIGVDLIFGLPGQKLEEWESDIREVLSWGAEHVSLYSLTMEVGTPFYELYGTGGPTAPTEEEVIAMYRSALYQLEKAGYGRYEVSNFALPGFASAHNRHYWDGGAYIGLGAGAHSYSPSPGWGKRSWNCTDTGDYSARVSATGRAVEGEERLTRGEALLETLFLGLRRREGVSLAVLRERFGLSPADCLPMEQLEGRGLISRDESRLALTEEGVLLADEVCAAARGFTSPGSELCP